MYKHYYDRVANFDEHENDFVEWLVEQGYKKYTPSGGRSTAFEYADGVEKVRQRERLTETEMIENIGMLIKKYDIGGAESEFGSMRHRTIINALKRYREFILSNGGMK